MSQVDLLVKLQKSDVVFHRRDTRETNVIFMDNYLLFLHGESFLLQTGLFVICSFVMVSQVNLHPSHFPIIISEGHTVSCRQHVLGSNQTPSTEINAIQPDHPGELIYFSYVSVPYVVHSSWIRGNITNFSPLLSTQ